MQSTALFTDKQLPTLTIQQFVASQFGIKESEVKDRLFAALTSEQQVKKNAELIEQALGYNVNASGAIILLANTNLGIYLVYGHSQRRKKVVSSNGSCEPGESMAETALREFAEELGNPPAQGILQTIVNYPENCRSVRMMNKIGATLVGVAKRIIDTAADRNRLFINMSALYMNATPVALPVLRDEIECINGRLKKSAPYYWQAVALIYGDKKAGIPPANLLDEAVEENARHLIKRFMSECSASITPSFQKIFMATENVKDALCAIIDLTENDQLGLVSKAELDTLLLAGNYKTEYFAPSFENYISHQFMREKKMGKVFKDGNWVLTRDGEEPDSNRHVERDDPLFAILSRIFSGEDTTLDLEVIAKEKGLNPEDVFIDLHENYGYVCIGTGENPAFDEKLSEEEKQNRQRDIKRMLEAEKLPHILIKGKYMGVEENSYFIPFNHKAIGLHNVLQSEVVRKLEKIATFHNQDSLLICQNGYACYLYTSGSQKGNVITGRTAVVYPGQQQLPDDCYSLFFNQRNMGTVGFTCGLNFNRIYANIEEYAAEENKTLQRYYNEFQVDYAEPAGKSNRQKVVILLRGTDGYNAYAVSLMQALQKSGLKAVIFGSDANIAKINEEVATDNQHGGPKAGWQWPQIRGEFLRRNQEIYRSLLTRDDIDVIVYADMNKLVQFMEPYIKGAADHGYRVVTQVVNSFVFEPRRSDYVQKLCHQFGDFMGRHVQDFLSDAAQINAKRLTVGDFIIEQYHGMSVQDFSTMLAAMLGKRHAAFAQVFTPPVAASSITQQADSISRLMK